MNLILELPQDLEDELHAEADRLGIPLTEYAVKLLAGSPRAAERSQSGAEIVERWRREGLIGYRSDLRDSAAHARRIRQRAETRAHG